MKLQTPENPNYSAVVVRIKEVHPLEGCDNVIGTTLLGFQAIVGKDTKEGDLGIVFPAESQLSEEYAYENNLFRHGDKNKDESAKGYLEDNRRVRAMRFRGHRSDCLFMPLTSLNYLMNNIHDAFTVAELSEGDTFDTLADHEICKKYVIPRTKKESKLEKNKNKFIRVDKKYLPEHYDTDNYFRNEDVIPDDREVIVTQKLHGTSIRIGNTYCARKLSLLEQIAKRLGVSVAEQEVDYVFGSRKVIKDANNPYQNHFYGTDIYTEEGSRLQGTLPVGYVLYGELIGWIDDSSPVQKHYTYAVPAGTRDIYIYRVATVNAEGFICDLSWDQVREFCKDRGLKTVPELWRGPMGEFKKWVNDFMDKRFYEGGYTQAVPLSPESPVDEGICIRADGIAPYILKAKSPLFYEHETKMLDEQVVDLESEESNV